jgi:transposase
LHVAHEGERSPAGYSYLDPATRGKPMSAAFRRYDPDQAFLFPQNPREWLPADHVAFLVMDVVGALDLKEILRHYEIKPVLDEQGRKVGEKVKSSRGKPAYDPRMMTALLIYAYVTGTPSSRHIEKKCLEDVAFRVLSANQKPDHSTIAEFRKIHLKPLAGLFLQVLKLCQKAGLVKLGHVALDGTKVKANASKHKAMSYERMVKKEEDLRQEIEDLLKRAQETDQAEDQAYGSGKRGDELPEELARRESRLKKIQEAKAALEAEAKAEAQRVRQAHEEEQKRREHDGEPPKPGKAPHPPEEPKDKAQRNFTDPESRIVRNADKAFIQGYNAQAAVDHSHQVIVACDVTQGADAPALKPMVQQVQGNTGQSPQQVSADAGYFSEENVKSLEAAGIDPYIAAERLKHGAPAAAPHEELSDDATLKERMIGKLRTHAARAVYALRKITVEPVFGQIRTRGLMRFWLRGLENVKAEWALWCTGHNLLKLFRSGGGLSALK